MRCLTMGGREPGIASLSHLRGRSALTPFRAQRLQQSLTDELPGLRRIDAEYLYFIERHETLDAAEQELLERLLDARPATSCDYAFIVVPRPGTISPWSSKATDIVHNCGLDRVTRVERGIAWMVDMSNGGVGHGHVTRALAARVHDRMTEAIIADVDAAHTLFEHAAARPLRSVRVMARGRVALEDANRDMGCLLYTSDAADE